MISVYVDEFDRTVEMSQEDNDVTVVMNASGLHNMDQIRQYIREQGISEDVTPTIQVKWTKSNTTIRRCQYCFKSDEKLSKCSSCNVVHYCSKECQRRDWKTHKVYCNSCKEGSKEDKKKHRELYNTILEYYALHKDDSIVFSESISKYWKVSEDDSEEKYTLTESSHQEYKDWCEKTKNIDEMPTDSIYRTFYCSNGIRISMTRM